MTLINFSPNTVIKSADVDTNLSGLSDGSLDATANSLTTTRNDAFQDFFASGCNWSITSGLVGTMTSGVVLINGKRLTVSAVATKTFTATNDNYVYLQDNGDGTAVVSYQTPSGGQNTGSPTIPVNAVLNAIIVCNGTNITTINQGDPATANPTIGGTILAVTDSGGNLIYPTSPTPGMIGYRQITADFTSANVSTNTDITGLNTSILVPLGRRVRLTLWAQRCITSAATQNVSSYIFEGTNQITEADNSTGSNVNAQANCVVIIAPTAGLHTYKGVIAQGGSAGTMRFGAGATSPAFISAELV